MRLSEFQQAVADEFGEQYGRVLVADLVLADLGDRTASAALAGGVPARAVWESLCAAMDVPPNRRYGVGLPEPKE